MSANRSFISVTLGTLTGIFVFLAIWLMTRRREERGPMAKLREAQRLLSEAAAETAAELKSHTVETASEVKSAAEGMIGRLR